MYSTLKETIERIWEHRELLEMPMGTKTAEELWKSRLSFYISFYENLVRQLECSERVLE